MNSQDPSQPSLPPAMSMQSPAAQDPLAQLQDIHMPAEIGLWPPAWGWWLLLIISIASILALVFFIKRRKSRNAYRSLAVAELNNTQTKYSSGQSAEYLQAVSILLRRTALSGFETTFHASLKGSDWLQWLDEQCPKTNQQFSQGVGTALLIGPYQKSPAFDRDELHRLSLLWINEHRNQWQAQCRTNKTNNNSEAKHDV